MDTTQDVLRQSVTALTAAYLVLAECLHQKDLLHKNVLAEALALLPDRLGQDLQGPVTKTIFAGLQGALVSDLKIDLSGLPEWLRNELKRKPD